MSGTWQPPAERHATMKRVNASVRMLITDPDDWIWW
jgi:hypothetical protein